MMEINDISSRVIGCAIEIHKALGPGLLESAYHSCLKREMELAGLQFVSEVPVAIQYKGVVIPEAYRVDLLVEDKLIIELKAQDKIADQHKAQLLTYLRLLDRRLGLLINFNEVNLKSGVRRVVNNL